MLAFILGSCAEEVARVEEVKNEFLCKVPCLTKVKGGEN